jgi:hypothetical protein
MAGLENMREIKCENCKAHVAQCKCGSTETFTSDWPEEGPACPHCGFIAELNDTEAYHLLDEGVYEQECPKCENDYDVDVSVSYAWTSTK